MKKSTKLKSLPSEYTDINFVSLNKNIKIREPSCVFELSNTAHPHQEAEVLASTYVSTESVVDLTSVSTESALDLTSVSTESVEESVSRKIPYLRYFTLFTVFNGIYRKYRIFTVSCLRY